MQSLWMLAASLFFALMAVCTKLSAANFGTFELVFYRNVFGVVFLGAWILLTHRQIGTRYFFSHIKRSFFGTFALTIWFWTLGLLPLGTSMTLNYTSPLYMALIVSAIMMRRGEKPHLGLIAAVIVGFLGVVLALRPEIHAGQELPAMIGLTSGILSALAYMQIKSMTKLGEPDWRIVFYFSCFGTCWGLAGNFITVGSMTPVGLADVPALLGIGASAVLAQICMTHAWGAGNMLLTSALQFSAIVFAAVLGLLIFSEPIPLETAAGIALIIVSGVTATAMTKRASSKSAAAKK
ncbi:DMT family transporter [Sutterella sp.]|uniref:DMT family transporter n=1 Tax=Sutterella sp. TaxID=1981025 RepID=UPI0026E07581|nr:DMT family transporter [Sutterella sp.]MDO5530690.1 DMT family transporter [Sutterella sp.]